MVNTLWGGILLWCEGISRLVEEVLENCIIASRGGEVEPL